MHLPLKKLFLYYIIAYDSGQEVYTLRFCAEEPPKETQLSAMLAGNEYFHIHRYADEAEIMTQVRLI